MHDELFLQLRARPEVRAAPYEVDSDAGAGAPPAARMSVQAFFALLRRHVPASRLQALLAALADFNAGRKSADALMATADAALRPPADELRAARLQPADTDLVAAFRAYMVPR